MTITVEAMNLDSKEILHTLEHNGNITSAKQTVNKIAKDSGFTAINNWVNLSGEIADRDFFLRYYKTSTDELVLIRIVL